MEKFDFILDWKISNNNIKINYDKILGKGEFGIVYLALWNKTPVVVKIMNKDLTNKKENLFLKELEIMTKLHHPNILQIFGYIQDPFGIVMEYIDNGELLDFINSKFIFKKKKINIIIDILRGLAYLHNRNPNYLIHRDIKPQNILMTQSGIPKISDFGISRFFENDLKSEFNIEKNIDNKDKTTLVGSKRYLAPEIKLKKDYDYKVDIWSAGVIFYELFEGERYIPENGFCWFNTPKNIKNIISKNMIQNDPANRLNADDLIDLFEETKKKKYFFF